MTLIGDGRLTIALLALKPRTTHGESGAPGRSAVFLVVVLAQGVDHESASHLRKEVTSAQDKLTLRQKTAMPQPAGQTLESGAAALSHGNCLCQLRVIITDKKNRDSMN